MEGFPKSGHILHHIPGSYKSHSLKLRNTYHSGCQLQKRDYYEYDNLSAVECPRKFAKVHGVITELSSMNGKYFEWRLADEETSVRIVGFDTIQQRELAAKMDSETTSVTPQLHCPKQLRADDMEIVVSGTTDFHITKEISTCTLP
jgi:hypothetical protein